LWIAFQREQVGNPKINEAVSCYYFLAHPLLLFHIWEEIYCQLLIYLGGVTWSLLLNRSFQFHLMAELAQWPSGMASECKFSSECNGSHNDTMFLVNLLFL